MQATKTPAGEIIIRLEAGETQPVSIALRNAAMACEVWNVARGPVMLDPRLNAEQCAELVEQLGEQVQKAVES
jgi:hypothetical protein